MQHSPTQTEITSLSTMAPEEKLQYFLTRTVETEEVWAQADSEGWILNEDEERVILRLWPYAQLASSYTRQEHHCFPNATSLDHFVGSILVQLIENNIELDILPTNDTPGIRITAGKLSELYESLLDAGDYYLEG